MWFGHEFSLGWAIFSVLMMVAFWGGFIALAVWVVRGFSRAGSAQSSSGHGVDVSPGGSALEILKQRYARGEITKPQFDEIRRDIKD